MGISFDFRSEDYGELQHLVDALFAPGVSRYATVTKLDVLMRAEAFTTSVQTSPRSLTCALRHLHAHAAVRPDELHPLWPRLGRRLRHGGVGQSHLSGDGAVFHEPCENG